MTLAEWAYQMSHIPGSLNISNMGQAQDRLDPEDDIVFYCCDTNCLAGRAAYHDLTKNGFKNVRRFSGGLAERQAAGYPLEGEAH